MVCVRNTKHGIGSCIVDKYDENPFDFLELEFHYFQDFQMDFDVKVEWA